MRTNALLLILSLTLILPACSKKEETKAPAASEVVLPDRGPVNLGQPQQGKATRSDVPRGYDPAKWDTLPEATKAVIARENALTQKRKANPNMTDQEYMGEAPKPPKF